MKHFLISIFVCILFVFNSNAATFMKGEENIISYPIHDNLYIGGTSVIIDNIIQGDLMAAGAQVSINDTVFENVFIAGGDILINAYLADDAKLFGENVKILKSIHGDLIVCGASITIHKEVVIHGDLLIAGGNVIINGTINGNIKVMGGKVFFNGIVNGNFNAKADELTIDGKIKGTSELSANRIKLEEGAAFEKSVTYWHKNGTLDFDPYLSGATATYDASLNFFPEEKSWKSFGTKLVGLGVLYLLSILFVIFLMIQFLPRVFKRAAEQMRLSPIRNFGYGVLYFIGIPTISLFLMLTIIGIPVGFILFHLYLLSLLFSVSTTSVLLAYGMRMKYDKDWGKGKLWMVAFLTFIALKIISFIPIIGTFITFVLVSIAYGTLVLACQCWSKKED